MLRDALAKIISSPRFFALEETLRNGSAFHILGIEGKEIHHSALLAWLLSPTANHGLGTFALREFMMLALQFSNDSKPEPGVFIDAVDIDAQDLGRARVHTEYSLKRADVEKSVGRADIFVASDDERPLLLIEYKVNAQESGEQTTNYADWSKFTAEQHDRKQPLLVYLCPKCDEERAPHPSFTIIEYDDYCIWLETLLRRKPSRQAVFLIEELIACLARREDVDDEAESEHIRHLESHFSAELEQLRGATQEQRDCFESVIIGHEQTFAALQVSMKQRRAGSLPPSRAVTLMRAALHEKLKGDQWVVRGGAGSVSAISKPFRRTLARAFGHQIERFGTLDLQIFMDRPHHNASRCAMELSGGLPNIEPAATRQLRLKLAAALRDTHGESGYAEYLKSGQTVCSRRTVSEVGDDERELSDPALLAATEKSILEAATLMASFGDLVHQNFETDLVSRVVEDWRAEEGLD